VGVNKETDRGDTNFWISIRRILIKSLRLLRQWGINMLRMSYWLQRLMGKI